MLFMLVLDKRQRNMDRKPVIRELEEVVRIDVSGVRPSFNRKAAKEP